MATGMKGGAAQAPGGGTSTEPPFQEEAPVEMVFVNGIYQVVMAHKPTAVATTSDEDKPNAVATDSDEDKPTVVVAPDSDDLKQFDKYAAGMKRKDTIRERSEWRELYMGDPDGLAELIEGALAEDATDADLKDVQTAFRSLGGKGEDGQGMATIREAIDRTRGPMQSAADATSNKRRQAARALEVALASAERAEAKRRERQGKKKQKAAPNESPTGKEKVLSLEHVKTWDLAVPEAESPSSTSEHSS